MNRSEFIEKLAPYAVADMRKSRVPASLTIAQGCLESANGNSGLTLRANNLFGIKGTGPAGSVTMPTTEYRNGQPYTVNAAFRAYYNWGESVADHSALIQNGVSWNRALYHAVLGADGRTAAREIQKAGYATDPAYAEKLIAIMDAYNLYQYDEMAKEAEPMTAAEKQAFEELQETVKAQAAAIEQLTKLQDMECPEWAQEAFCYYGPYIANKTGSYDFWRMLTIQYRKEKGLKQ
jgi:flagellum-specific peptidoglycan hydrolase FlgJ